MKILVCLCISILTLFLSGCSSDADSPCVDFIEILINGKSYKNNIYHGGTGFSGLTGCEDKSLHAAYLSSFEDSSFAFVSYILYFENDSDFKNSKSGKYEIIEDLSTFCNLNLVVSFEDKIQSQSYFQLMSGGINTITSIKKGKSTSTKVDYIISGNFSSSFKNRSNTIKIINGKYQITVPILK